MRSDYYCIHKEKIITEIVDGDPQVTVVEYKHLKLDLGDAINTLKGLECPESDVVIPEVKKRRDDLLALLSGYMNIDPDFIEVLREEYFPNDIECKHCDKEITLFEEKYCSECWIKEDG